MTTTNTADAILIDLGNQLVAEIHTAREKLDAMPEEYWPGEQAEIDAAMARPDALMNEILAMTPSTAMGRVVLEIAERWFVGEVFGDDLLAA
jgi:hypothetical protein